MVNVFAGPEQFPVLGVTVMVAVMGAVVVFTALKAAMLSVPEDARPMEVLLLVQS